MKIEMTILHTSVYINGKVDSFIHSLLAVGSFRSVDIPVERAVLSAIVR